YRMNPYAYQIDRAPARQILPGYVGIVRRKQKALDVGIFGEKADEPGIVKDKSKILQPGLYYVNPEEYEIIPCEVGVHQGSNHLRPNPAKRTSIELRSSKGQKIQLDCTIEWEVLPETWPTLLAEVTKHSEKGGEKEILHGNLKTIEKTIVDQNAQ